MPVPVPVTNCVPPNETDAGAADRKPNALIGALVRLSAPLRLVKKMPPPRELHIIRRAGNETRR